MGNRVVDGTVTVFGKRIARLAAFAVLAAGLVAPVDAAGFLYRYRNAEGHAEISNSVPPERTALGYEVLNSYSMRVVEVVDPQKSPAEVARLERETQARNACQAALDRVNRQYQSELDVSAAEEHAITSLLTRIENAKVNLAQMQIQKRELAAEAARRERSGNVLNPGLRDSINRADQQINSLEEEIAARYHEQAAAKERFAGDLKLFTQGTCDDERAMQFLQAQASE
jgi:membrane-associated HD superfamily phosphohydrolase